MIQAARPRYAAALLIIRPLFILFIAPIARFMSRLGICNFGFCILGTLIAVHIPANNEGTQYIKFKVFSKPKFLLIQKHSFSLFFGFNNEFDLFTRQTISRTSSSISLQIENVK